MKDLIASSKYFLIWKILTTIFILFSINFISAGNLHLGGNNVLYSQNPYFWSHSNFDGTHYLRIARYGYQELTYFFFPLYPLLINIFSKLAFNNTDLENIQLVSIILSNFFAFTSFWGFYKLLKIDFKKDKLNIAMLSLVLFPTSIYLGTTYTESLFLSSVVWSFYFFRKEKYILSGIFGGLSTATRIVGANLIVSYLSELNLKKNNFRKILFYFLTLSGLFLYMLYLYQTTGNAFMFNIDGNNFGEYRSPEIVLLPVVFYRYIFKILPNLNYNYFWGTFTPALELVTALGLLFSSIVGFFKLRRSYYLFLVASFIMPTLYNSFVSLHRFALVMFPIHILVAFYLHNKSKLKMLYFLVSTILMFIVSIMFTRGIWIA